MMVPFEVVFFTNLQTVVALGDVPVVGRFVGLDTYGALAIPFLATGFGAFLMRQAFLAIRPTSRRRRARRLRALAIHVAGRGTARPADNRGARLFAFFDAWNQYLWPWSYRATTTARCRSDCGSSAA